MRRAVLLTVMLLAACTGGDDASVESVTSVRPPLASPPNPPDPPDDDGFSDGERDRVAASTVRVSGIACGRLTEGSGFAVAEDLFATNAHVVVGLPAPTIETLDGRSLEGEVVAFDGVLDLALIAIEDAGIDPLPLATAAPDGTVGAVFGWEPGPEVEPTPFRVDRPVAVNIVEVGGVDKVRRPSWLLAADIEAGDSGAAVVNRDGEVIGVNYSRSANDTRVGYAVRAEMLTELIDRGFNSNLILPPCGGVASAGEVP
ncbi:MAG: trypsin-like peptidase domain-containing protein [Actinomycetota bacterium]